MLYSLLPTGFLKCSRRAVPKARSQAFQMPERATAQLILSARKVIASGLILSTRPCLYPPRSSFHVLSFISYKYMRRGEAAGESALLYYNTCDDHGKIDNAVALYGAGPGD